ncbi:MAG: carboxypeptidase-like regulatory domain-containing protein, partial [Massilibacteroides sp.]|nr:carboxypeptidase-like regulatory domain-containing protein [Massilibacteroides sp.]
MRITLVLLFVVLFESFAFDSYSQETNVSVKAGQMKLTELFTLIEQQSEFLFFYIDADVKDVDVKLKTQSKKIDDILLQALSGTNLTYVINERNVNILKRHEVQQQTLFLTGVITDQNGDPIIGANVVVKGTTNGTITDLDGKYNLSVGPTDVLLITYIGYNRQEINVSGRTVINIEMVEDTQTLDEVVVIGYGTARK